MTGDASSAFERPPRPCLSCRQPLDRGEMAFCADCKSNGTAETFRERQS